MDNKKYTMENYKVLKNAVNYSKTTYARDREEFLETLRQAREILEPEQRVQLPNLVYLDDVRNKMRNKRK